MLVLTSLGAEGGVVRIPSGRPALIVFWRSDCAPCVEGLVHKPLLQSAAGKLRTLWVALEPAGKAQQALARFSIAPSDVYATTDDPARLLLTYGGAPPRLPLAVLLDGRGRVIDRRHGLLGLDTVRMWARRCSR